MSFYYHHRPEMGSATTGEIFRKSLDPKYIAAIRVSSLDNTNVFYVR